jgi:hypothetical protein
MSSIYVIAMSTAIFMGWIALYYHLTAKTNAAGNEVFAGVVQGAVISPTYRWVMLLQVWLPHALGIVISSLFIGFAQFQIAKSATDPNAQIVADAYAVLMFVASGATFLFAIAVFWMFASRIASNQSILTDD